MDKTLKFDSTEVLTVQVPAPHMQAIVMMLKKLPYETAQPIIDNLFAQLQPKDEVHVPQS